MRDNPLRAGAGLRVGSPRSPGPQPRCPGAAQAPRRAGAPRLPHPGRGRPAAPPRDQQLLKKTGSRREPKNHLETVIRWKAFPSPGPGESRGELAPTPSRPEELSVPGLSTSIVLKPMHARPLPASTPLSAAELTKRVQDENSLLPAPPPPGTTEQPLVEDWAPSWAGSRGTVRASCGSSPPLPSPPLRSPSPPWPAPNCK